MYGIQCAMIQTFNYSSVVSCRGAQCKHSSEQDSKKEKKISHHLVDRSRCYLYRSLIMCDLPSNYKFFKLSPKRSAHVMKATPRGEKNRHPLFAKIHNFPENLCLLS